MNSNKFLSTISSENVFGLFLCFSKFKFLVEKIEAKMGETIKTLKTKAKQIWLVNRLKKKEKQINNAKSIAALKISMGSSEHVLYFIMVSSQLKNT